MNQRARPPPWPCGACGAAPIGLAQRLGQWLRRHIAEGLRRRMQNSQWTMVTVCWCVEQAGVAECFQ
eukprot:2573441-Lingulodinium_polyedra.AAC.1